MNMEKNESIENVQEVQNTGKEIDYSNDPEGRPIKGFPKHIKILSNGMYKIEMRKIEGVANKFDYVVLKDIKFRKMHSLLERAKGPDGETDTKVLNDLLILNAIVYPNITQDDIDDLKTSESFRLSGSINLIYDVPSFLLE